MSRHRQLPRRNRSTGNGNDLFRHPRRHFSRHGQLSGHQRTLRLSHRGRYPQGNRAAACPCLPEIHNRGPLRQRQVRHSRTGRQTTGLFPTVRSDPLRPVQALVHRRRHQRHHTRQRFTRLRKLSARSGRRPIPPHSFRTGPHARPQGPQGVSVAKDRGRNRVFGYADILSKGGAYSKCCP